MFAKKFFFQFHFGLRGEAHVGGCDMANRSRAVCVWFCIKGVAIFSYPSDFKLRIEWLQVYCSSTPGVVVPRRFTRWPLYSCVAICRSVRAQLMYSLHACCQVRNPLIGGGQSSGSLTVVADLPCCSCRRLRLPEFSVKLKPHLYAANRFYHTKGRDKLLRFQVMSSLPGIPESATKKLIKMAKERNVAIVGPATVRTGANSNTALLLWLFL